MKQLHLTDVGEQRQADGGEVRDDRGVEAARSESQLLVDQERKDPRQNHERHDDPIGLEIDRETGRQRVAPDRDEQDDDHGQSQERSPREELLVKRSQQHERRQGAGSRPRQMPSCDGAHDGDEGDDGERSNADGLTATAPDGSSDHRLSSSGRLMQPRRDPARALPQAFPPPSRRDSTLESVLRALTQPKGRRSRARTQGRG